MQRLVKFKGCGVLACVARLCDEFKPLIFSRYFVALLLIYFLGISAILRADALFQDDVVRAMDGHRGWGAASRPLADFFAYAFYWGSRTYDASPFTQLVSMFILAVASLMLLRIVRVRSVKLGWMHIFSVVPLGLSPYILNCISFKFDSPYMASALIFALLPFLFKHLTLKTFTIASAICLYCSAALYHAALGAYLCVLIYFCLKDISSRKHLCCVWKRFWRLSLPFALGIGCFSVYAHFRKFNPYSEQHSKLPDLMDIPATFAANCKIYLSTLFNDWNKSGLGLLMGMIFLTFIFSLLMRWQINRHKNSKNLKPSPNFRPWFRLTLFFLLIAGFVLSPYGLQLLLQNPNWSPRMFQSFGALLALLLLHLCGTGGKKFRWATVTAQCLMVMQLLVFANICGNLLARQDEWEFVHIAPLSIHLRELIQKKGCPRIIYAGSIGYTPLLNMPGAKFPLLARNLQNPVWAFRKLKFLGIDTPMSKQALPEASLLIPYLENAAYRIEVTTDNLAVVTMKLAPNATTD